MVRSMVQSVQRDLGDFQGHRERTDLRHGQNVQDGKGGQGMGGKAMAHGDMALRPADGQPSVFCMNNFRCVTPKIRCVTPKNRT